MISNRVSLAPEGNLHGQRGVLSLLEEEGYALQVIKRAPNRLYLPEIKQKCEEYLLL